MLSSSADAGVALALLGNSITELSTCGVNVIDRRGSRRCSRRSSSRSTGERCNRGTLDGRVGVSKRPQCDGYACGFCLAPSLCAGRKIDRGFVGGDCVGRRRWLCSRKVRCHFCDRSRALRAEVTGWVMSQAHHAVQQRTLLGGDLLILFLSPRWSSVVRCQRVRLEAWWRSFCKTSGNGGCCSKVRAGSCPRPIKLSSQARSRASICPRSSSLGS